MTYLRHINLATGRAERVARGDLDAGKLRDMANTLDRAVAEDGDEPALETIGEYELGAIDGGRCLLAAIYRAGNLEARIGVATHSRCAVKIWELLCEMPANVGLQPVHAERPKQPWSAIRTAVHARDPQGIDRMARVLAWAWFERVREAAIDD